MPLKGLFFLFGSTHAIASRGLVNILTPLFLSVFLKSSVGVCEAAHAAHDAQHVVVAGVDNNLLGLVDGGEASGAAEHVAGQVVEVQLEGGGIQAGEVAGARGLVLLRAQGERVGVETTQSLAGVLVVATSVVLVCLHAAEVAALTSAEAIGAVELELGLLYELVVGALGQVVGVHSHVLVERGGPVVEGVLVGHVLDAPHELLDGVVEVQVDVGVLVGGGHGGGAVLLELLDQILVALGGEAAALIGVQVDVIYIQEHLVQVDRGEVTDAAQACLAGEVYVELDLVVLEGDQGKCKTRVAVEPELKRHVELGLGVGASSALIELSERAVDEGAELLPLLLRVSQLGPHVHPLTVVGVDDLAADLDLYLLDHKVTKAGSVEAVGALLDPLTSVADVGRGDGGGSGTCELHIVAVVGGEAIDGASGGTTNSHGACHAGGEGIGSDVEVDLKIHAVGKVTVAAHGASHLAAEGGLTVEGLLDGLHGEVGVTPSHEAEESDLGLTSQVNILGSVSYKLHKSSSHFVLVFILQNSKIILEF